MNMHWYLYLGNQCLPSKTTGKQKLLFLEIWRDMGEKLKSSSSMSEFCYITDLTRFMMKEAEKMMKGSVHEDDLFIVHDALVLMTAKETIEWTKEKNCFHRWFLSMNGL